MGRFPLVHALFTAFINNAFGIAQNGIVMRQAHCLDQLKTGNAGRAGAINADFDILNVAARQVQRIDETGGANNRRAVLVVMKHRNIHHFAQLAFNDKAIGRFDVFQINAAKARPQMLHRIDESVGVFRVQFEVNRVDIGKTFEQNRLTFHHRLRGQRAQIAQPQNRRAVGDDGDHIAA